AIIPRPIILLVRLATIPYSTHNFDHFVDDVVANNRPGFVLFGLALFVATKPIVVITDRPCDHRLPSTHLALAVSGRSRAPPYRRAGHLALGRQAKARSNLLMV